MARGTLPFGMTGRSRVRKFRGQGDAAMRERDWARAARAYRLYLAYHAKDTAILVQFGHALKELGRIDEALQAYSSAVSNAPADSDARLHLTALLHGLGDERAPLPVGDAAVSLLALDDPEPAPADLTPAEGIQAAEAGSSTLGDRERDRKNWREAAWHYSAHLAEHPRDSAIWVQLGHMLKEALMAEDALYAYRVAKRLEAEPSDVAVHLADLLQRLGRSTEARPLWADLYRQNGTFFLHAI